MDYLRNLGSAAVSTLVQKSGLNLPFSLGAKVTSLDGVCSLYDGTKRDDGSNVSIFEYDFSTNKKYAPLARNALRKLRTTRHPDIVKFIDAVETETSIHIMTERVRPLRSTLDDWALKSQQEKEDWLLWGLHRISVALAFINESCMSTHGNLHVNAVFLSPSGEWKLGGFELFSNPKDIESAVLYTFANIYPDSMAWAPPEVKKDGWSDLKRVEHAAPDAYALGLLLNATFNPTNHPPPTSNPPHPPPTATSRGSIPTSIFPLFKKLVNPNAKARLTAKGFLEVGMTDTGFFSSNRLVKVCGGLDNFSVSSEADKSALLRNLTESVNSFPPEFCAHRILPSLISALQFGGASAATILPLCLQFGKNLTDEQYTEVLIAPIVQLYHSPDRGTRMTLLDHLPEYADKLDKKTVDSKIFPQLQTGFSDTVAVIREATLKATTHISAKLSDRTLNNELLRHLAKMQQDPEASIRTNTCILIGRLGPTLGYNTRRKVLVPAFARALKDIFSHARVAGMMAFMANIDSFEAEDLATKVIPTISPALLDKEKIVRTEAFKALQLFVTRLELHASKMPDTAIVDGQQPGQGITLPTDQDALIRSVTAATGSLTQWAMSSFGKQMDASTAQSRMTGADRPTSAPPGEQASNGGLSRPSPLITSISAANSTVSSPAFPPASKGKSLQLGASKTSSNLAAASSLADEWIEEAAAENDKEGDNPWGTDDLMDVNADQDYWSAFEAAPVIPIAQPKPVVNGLGFAHLSSSSSKPAVSSPSPRSIVSSPPMSPPAQNEDWTDSWDTPEPVAAKPKASPSIPLTAAVSKEDKAAEMARRKEERRLRIAMLKEQKKQAAKP